MQIPPGPEHLDCPLWKKPMSKVCHKCPSWMMMPMVERDGRPAPDEWRCGIFTWAPLVMRDIVKESARGAEAGEHVRNHLWRTALEAVPTLPPGAVPPSLPGKHNGAD